MAEHSYLSESERATRLAAQRATGERWFLYLHGHKPPFRVSVGYQDIKPECQATLFPLDRDGHFQDNDAEFICLTDPKFTLSVLDRLEEALKENKKLRQRIEELEYRSGEEIEVMYPQTLEEWKRRGGLKPKEKDD